jgi:HAD domain in Swiss Army Knife RNA repair proteins
MTSAVSVIFLDIDDVLNTLSTRQRGELFDPVNVRALNAILDATTAGIVVSSTWRLSASTGEWEEILKGAGIHATGRVLGRTPWLEGAPRGAEIAYWLEQALVEVTCYAILDNRDDMMPCQEHLLQTSPEYGLTDDLARESISRLH